jgi:HlyD family secretion protein
MNQEKVVRRVAWIAVALVAVGGIAWALQPQPLAIESARVTRGALTATVTGEGRAQVKDLYVVSAPVAGDLVRLTLRPGDEVPADAVVARIQPLEAHPLDARSRAEALAAVSAARSAMERAKASEQEASVAAQHADSELGRLRKLTESGAVGAAAAEHAGHESDMRHRALDAARAAVSEASAELARATAVVAPAAQGDRVLEVKTPIAGRILRVVHESAGPIAAGTPLVEIGDPTSLEISGDLLSSDAALVRIGAQATITGWGAAQVLAGRVRRVDPAAFTKISALGLEEQRVHVVADLLEPPPPGLGHDYRVDLSIATWSGVDVLRVPSTALFRSGDRWAVFAIRDGRARRVVIDPGPADGTWTVIEQGLDEGVRVVVQPSDELREGMRVR